MKNKTRFLRKVVLQPYGTMSTSAIVSGSSITVQFGWDVDPAVKIGQPAYLYEIDKGQYYVAATALSEADAFKAAESLFSKALSRK